MTKHWNRRQFTRFLGLAALSASAGHSRRVQSNEKKLRLAFIGVGGRGGANLATITKDADVEVVALCDVNSKHLNKAALQFPGARSYADFRELYQQTNDIDGVVISTSEHTHAYATLPALRLGKHVYCEKPLTHNVSEARLVAQEAARAGVVTQMGTQIHASNNYRRVVELIQSDAIGPVTEVHVWVSRAWGRQTEQEATDHKDIVFVRQRPTEAMQPPEFLNWKLWLGPAEERPYHEVYFPGPKWYRWWDFGNGTMSDLGSHWIDLPFWALKLDAPLHIETKGDEPHHEIAPASMTARYTYAARAGMPACTLTWYQGTHRPEIWTEQRILPWNNGVLFVGSKGMLLSDYSKHVLLPEEQFKGFVPPEPFIANSMGQHEEWLAACRHGTPTGSPFHYAALLTEANHLGNVAYRAGGKIQWDSAKMRIVGDDSANRFLTRTPSTGWSLG